jgi:DNA-binding NarL/FixJ family response regulator
MRVVLVGPPARRARLRTRLPEQLEVVGEAETISDARRVADADAYLVAAAAPRDADDVPSEPLTAREREVLNGLADGLSNKAIAARLGISDETVKFHLSAIFGKLQASNRTDAVRQALRRGLVEI